MYGIFGLICSSVFMLGGLCGVVGYCGWWFQLKCIVYDPAQTTILLQSYNIEIVSIHMLINKELDYFTVHEE